MAMQVRCIDCGYLYAWNPKAYEIEDCVVDPELLRARPREQFPFKPDELVSGKPARFPVRSAHHPFQVKHHRLQDIEEFKCYKQGITLIPYAMRCSQFKDFNELYRTRDCAGYFPYHVGFSAQLHLQLEVESKRARRQEEFEKMLNERQERLTKIGLAISAISIASFVLSIIKYLCP